MIRGLGEAAKQLGIATEVSKPDKAIQKQQPTEDGAEPPMMYRAQVKGRCSLMFASEPKDLNRWTEEWVYPNLKNHGQPTYQHQEPDALGWNGSVYRMKVQFPFRLCSNCGQDSILRPVIGKHGIPFIPGSSVKGLFRRACNEQQARDYCGNDAMLSPGSLRFHGAYPVGDWAGTRQVRFQRKGETISETRYRFVDVLHPQQDRQVQGTGSAKAFALISFYQPTLIFELSSPKPEETDWQEVAGLLRTALRQGLGGKTTTGYGLPFIPKNRYALNLYLEGIGVSPLLRSDEPEFRPNLFKATLRGHISRLLAGVCSQDAVNRKVGRLFGQTSAPAEIELYWESKALNYSSLGGNATYTTKGILHVDLPQSIASNPQQQAQLNAQRNRDLEFLKRVLRFTLVMAGLGKSWRRVWHKQFYSSSPNYARPIGCHWKADSDEISFDIATPEDLKKFLDELHQFCREQFGDRSSNLPNWKEAWNPKQVAVFSQVVSRSQIIDLFHDPTFKTTPAIGGKNPNDLRPTHISSVWHRMLPINNGQFLEIVTLFHGDDQHWKRKGVPQRLPFIQAIERQGLQLSWGSKPRS